MFRRQFHRGCAISIWLMLSINCFSQSSPNNALCLEPRDIVFIVDQSGTMAGNDPRGFRWKLIEHTLNQLNQLKPKSDRVAIIPFGGKSQTDKYIRSNYPSNKKPQWYELAQPITKAWLLKNPPLQPSDTTDIKASFEHFKRYFIDGNETNDLFIFFISDGLLDLRPDLPRDTSAVEIAEEKKHDQELKRLLREHSDSWRLYNICLGDSTDIVYHDSMLAQIKLDHGKRSKTLYPHFPNHDSENPFLLHIAAKTKDSSLTVMKRNIEHILSLPYESQLRAGPMPNNSTETVMGRGSLALTLNITVKSPANLKPRIDPDAFRKNKLIFKFELNNGQDREVDLIQESSSHIDTESFKMKFKVDSLDVAEKLRNMKATVKNIVRWHVGIVGLEDGQTVEDLVISYQHGWVFQVSRIVITPEIPASRSLDSRILGGAEACKPVLYFYAKVQNLCGQKVEKTEASLEILGDPARTRHVLKVDPVESKVAGANGIGDEYVWRAEIRGDAYLLSKLGEKVSIVASFDEYPFILDDSGDVPVKVCADYKID